MCKSKFQARLVRGLYLFVWACGLAFGCWGLWSGLRLAIMVTLLVVVYLSLRSLEIRAGISRLWNWLDTHPGAGMVVVLLLGVIFRLLLAWTYGGEAFAQTNLVSDSRFIWDAISSFSEGRWVENKSWTTTVLYGAASKYFGNDLGIMYVITGILNSMSTISAYLVGVRIGNRAMGVVSSAFVAFSPFLGVLSLKPMTEHCFVLFVLLSIYAALRGRQAQHQCSSMVWGVVCALFGLLALWSRGEGFLVVVLTTGFLIMPRVSCGWVRNFMICVPMLFVLLAGGAFAMRVNRSCSGTPTVFCSTDNLWPRLFGCNLETVGRYCWLDKRRMFEAYLKDHPECDWGRAWYRGRFPMALRAKCPPELAPYLEREIKRRWRALGWCDGVRLILHKEMIWRDDGCYLARGFPVASCLGARLLFAVFPCIILFCLAMLSRRVMRNEQMSSGLTLMLLVLLGDCALLAITEVAPRYTLLLHVMGPFFVGGLLCDVVRSPSELTSNSRNGKLRGTA